jgi:hypothetical protein
MTDFPTAVRSAIGAGVPCLRPYSGIELLQLINSDDVHQYGVFKHTHDLNNPGNNAGTLITCIDETEIKKELEELVERASVIHVKTLDVTQVAFLMAGFNASIPLPNNDDLVNVGLKVTSDDNWSLTIGNHTVTKKAVSEIQLKRFLARSHVDWNFDYTMGVVTGIYYIAGGLTFTGDAKAVTTAGAHLVETPNVPVNVTAGWNFTGSNTGKIVVAQNDTVDWVVAIDYLPVGPGEKEASTGQRPVVPKGPIVKAAAPEKFL